MRKKRIKLLIKLFKLQMDNVPNKTQLRKLKKHYLRNKELYNTRLKKLKLI